MEAWSGKFELVNPREILVDHRYQRPEKPDLIARIASSPDWEAFGSLSCFKRGEMYVCTDGQQRLKGILSVDTPPRVVPVIVHPEVTIAHEASIFVRVNVDRKAVYPYEKHRGLLVANEPVALALERAVEKAGFSISTDGSPRSISAISTLYGMYNDHGEEGIVQILVLIRDAWPDEKSGSSANILRGLAEIIAGLNGDVSRAKLTQALQRTHPDKILRKAEELRFDTGGSKQASVRRAFKALAKI